MRTTKNGIIQISHNPRTTLHMTEGERKKCISEFERLSRRFFYSVFRILISLDLAAINDSVVFNLQTHTHTLIQMAIIYVIAKLSFRFIPFSSLYLSPSVVARAGAFYSFVLLSLRVCVVVAHVKEKNLSDI